MSELRHFVDAFFKALEQTASEPAAPKKADPTQFTARNFDDYLIIYHGDEAVAKVSPEHADQLVGELSLALKKRNGAVVDA